MRGFLCSTRVEVKGGGKKGGAGEELGRSREELGHCTQAGSEGRSQAIRNN